MNNFMEINYQRYDMKNYFTKRNGRIDILYDTNTANNGSTQLITSSVLSENNVNSVSQSLTNTPLSLNFFSKENINRIQAAIINGVYVRSDSNFVINNQNENELLIIMRSHYLQFGKNLPSNINYQVNELNNMVVSWSVDNIISNIEQYISYKKTCSALPMPLERAQLPSQKGTKNDELTKSYI